MTDKINNRPTVIRTNRGLTIAGTRITLYAILDYVKLDWPAKLIRDRFNLTDKQIKDVLAYIEEHRDEVEAEYQIVLEQAEKNRHYWEERNREKLAEIAVLPPKPGQEEIVTVHRLLMPYLLPDGCMITTEVN